MNQKAFIELCSRDPLYFFQNIVVASPKGEKKLGDIWADFQKRDFKAVTPSLKYLAGISKTKPKYQRFFIQRSRGSSKTSDIALVVLWLLLFSKKALQGYCTAEDKAQAGLIRQQMIQIVQYNQWIGDLVEIKKTEVENKETQSIMKIESSDEMSSFGWTPDFLICDEFSHWTKEGFWSSVASSFTKRAATGGILIVACNAGAGHDWKYQVKQAAMDNDLWFHDAPHGVAPWFNEKDIKEQRDILPKSEFSRLWENVWQASIGEFVTVEEADKCIDPNLVKLDGTLNEGWNYVASIDYAEKTDRTVGCVTHLFGEDEDSACIHVDLMEVLDPECFGGSIRLEWVEQWIRNVQRDFGGNHGNVYFIVDKYQLLYLIQKLSGEGFAIEPFDFGSGIGNWEMSLILRQLILHQKVKWYEDCGKILKPDGTPFRPEDGRDDLSTELGNLTVKKMYNGKKWRIDHTDGTHDDRAVALGMCCHFIVQNSGGFGGWNITAPTTEGKFNLAV